MSGDPWAWTETFSRTDRPLAEPDDFPFPLAEPLPAPVMISRPCGCTSMDAGDGQPPVQVSWCDEHDPGYPEPQP